MKFQLFPPINDLRSSRWWRKRAIGVAVSYVAVFVAAIVFQRSLLYPPAHISQANFEHVVHDKLKATLLAPFDAIVLEPPAGATVRGTAIWYHGNGGIGGSRMVLAENFTQRGLRLVLAEYPGYGPREGEKSETSFVDDGRALYSAVRRQYPGPVLLVGESLGGGIASAIAADPGTAGPPDRLALVTPFRSMDETAARVLWMFPARYFVKDHYRVEANLLKYHGPLSILVAGKDDVVGTAQGRALVAQQNLLRSSNYIELPRAKHNDWPMYMFDAAWNRLLGLDVETRVKAPTS